MFVKNKKFLVCSLVFAFVLATTSNYFHEIDKHRSILNTFTNNNFLSLSINTNMVCISKKLFFVKFKQNFFFTSRVVFALTSSFVKFKSRSNFFMEGEYLFDNKFVQDEQTTKKSFFTNRKCLMFAQTL